MRKKIFGVLYAVSFFSLIPFAYASSYITAQTWADIIMFITVFCWIYIGLYILWLRKKEAVGFGKAAARFFLYLSVVIVTGLIIHYASLFFNGFTPTDVFGHPLSERKYGFKAIAEDGWGNMVYLPMLIISLIYQAGYFLCVKKTVAKKDT